MGIGRERLCRERRLGTRPEWRYLVRQFAIVSGTVGIAVAAEVREGGSEAGVDAINSLADWVVDKALTEY